MSTESATSATPIRSLTEKDRFGRLIERRDGHDFPFYNGTPIELSVGRWILVWASVAVGFFALALFAFLAAVYLTLETQVRELQEDFRARALVAGVAVGLLALIVFVLAEKGAPTVRAGISRSWWALGLHIFTAVFATGAFYALWTKKYRLSRICAASQVTLILLGWAFAQRPQTLRDRRRQRMRHLAS